MILPPIFTGERHGDDEPKHEEVSFVRTTLDADERTVDVVWYGRPMVPRTDLDTGRDLRSGYSNRTGTGGGSSISRRPLLRAATRTPEGRSSQHPATRRCLARLEVTPFAV